MIFFFENGCLLFVFACTLFRVGTSIRVGDRSLTPDQWIQFQKTLSCWMSPEGNWTAHPERRPLITTTYSNDESLATKIYSACGPVESRRGLEYWWTPPPECPALSTTLTLENMCHTMRGRYLVFAGDSLSLHHYENMLNILGNRTVYGYRSDRHDIFHWAQPYNCTPFALPSFSIIYLSWNSITYRTHLPQLARLDDKGVVLVVNWGAFFHGTATLMIHMHQLVHHFNTHHPHWTCIFRASNMAHNECEKYSVPDNVLHVPAKGPKPSFHWDVFPHQNQFWKDYLLAPVQNLSQNHDRSQYHESRNVSAQVNQWIYFDIFSLIAKRPDQHVFNNLNNNSAQGVRDCLHYCLPGPVETWSLLLHETLALLERSSSPLSALDRQEEGGEPEREETKEELEKEVKELREKVREMEQRWRERKRDEKPAQ